MAVGDGKLPEFATITGFRLGTAAAGIKKPDRKDLVLMEIMPGASVAGVFTQNRFCAAPVQIAKSHLAAGDVRYLLVNTGNANAGTGATGYQDALACCDAVASLSEVPATSVLPFSTGVIGEPLPVEPIKAGIPAAIGALSEHGWEAAAEGIMTTDTRPKGATEIVTLPGGNKVAISGISKGAGMIQPNMATMLAFAATDAVIEADLLQSWLKSAVDKSFNRITIDSDTSTNDSCMLVATGGSGVGILAGSEDEAVFRAALERLYLKLAQAIVKDGEGATKFVSVTVKGAASDEDALTVAYTVANSPLVKTALYASDPNWGRILAAVGRAPITELDVDRISIWLDDVCIVQHGGRDDSYTEARGQAVMDQEEIAISIDLARGDHQETVWTSDFSHEYVTINAEYRT